MKLSRLNTDCCSKGDRKKGAIALLSSLSLLPPTLLPVHPANASPLLPDNRLSNSVAQLDESLLYEPLLHEPLQFSPPVLPDRGRPDDGRRSGGASRGSCDTPGQLPLTALVPASATIPESSPGTSESEPNSTELSATESVFSLTTEASPTFWFYMPYTISDTPMEIVIQDEQNNTLYQGSVTGEQAESGIISVTLPDVTTELETGGLQTGNLYHWYFMAYCDESNPAFVEGWIERVPVSSALSQSLENASPRDQAVIYAQNGIWQNTITLLGQQYREGKDEENLFEDWRSLLESAGLEAIADQPLTDCCAL